LKYLGMAFGGLLRLIGLNSGTGITADIESIDNGLSISIPSALARGFSDHGANVNLLIASVVVGLAWVCIAASLYAVRRVPWFRWPEASRQNAEPYRRWIGVEWMAILATTLCFSPQTNSRHMILTCIIQMGAVAYLISRRFQRIAWTIVIGSLVLWAGLSFPPGHYMTITATQPADGARTLTAEKENDAVQAWQGISGPSWTLLLAMTLIAWGCMAPEKKSIGNPQRRESSPAATPACNPIE